MTNKHIELQQIQVSDAAALMMFYNSLGPTTIHTFRPLSEKTTFAVCQSIVEANLVVPRRRFDLTVWHGEQMIGWGFLDKVDGVCPHLGFAIHRIERGNDQRGAYFIMPLRSVSAEKDS